MTELADIRGPALATRLAVPVERSAVVRPQDAVEPDRAVEAAAQPQPPSSPPQDPKPVPARSGGFVPLLLGGAAAAGLGFLLASFVPTGWPRPAEPDPEIQSRLSALESQTEELAGIGEGIETLSARVDDLAARVDTLAADAGDAEAVAVLEADLDDVRQELAALGSTVGSLSPEAAAAAQLPDFTGEFNEQMAVFQAEIDRVTGSAEAEVAAARAEAEATRAAAEAAARQAALRAALADIEIAFDTGAPFADALSEIESLDPPEALAGVAEDGVSPLAELQRSFPDAARAALSVATRGPAEDAGPVDRFAAFLMDQTNARSLAPREGNDADAVLSRVEAALQAGDLAGAVAEAEALEEVSRQALGPWLEDARTRVAASEALVALQAQIDAM